MVLTDVPTEARQGFHLPIETKPHDRPTAVVTVDPDVGTGCPVVAAYLPVGLLIGGVVGLAQELPFPGQQFVQSKRCPAVTFPKMS